MKLLILKNALYNTIVMANILLFEYLQVWTWGKGDYYRLGHGSDQHVRKPTLLSTLKGVHLVDCAAGALHCLAVSSTGVVCIIFITRFLVNRIF